MKYNLFVKNICLTILLNLLGLTVVAQQASISGVVRDEQNQPIEFANVTIKGKPIGTATSIEGRYTLSVKADQDLVFVFSSIGYKLEEYTIRLAKGESKVLDISLEPDSKQLGQVVIEDKQVRKTTLTRLDPKIMNVIPDAAGNFEGILKTLPGVASNNELSSQYSVRGGSFDENLVYVNDIEIYRPFLIRAGQQEGMSFVNSDMVSSVLFSAGGFDARYGDKMSSVLDIKYKKPSGFGGVATASLMGGALTLMGSSKDGRFTHISGIRYKDTRNLLNSLETSGDYEPRFLDFQTYLTYDISEKLEVSFLGNIAHNQYRFEPASRTSKFGTMNTPLQLNIDFEGQEVDEFTTLTGAFVFNYSPTEHLDLKFIGSVFNTNEQETFDIFSYYQLSQAQKNSNTENESEDSLVTIGSGSYLKHARNYLQGTVVSFEHKGFYTGGLSSWQWGVRAQGENIQDNLSEWKMVDSAGYSLPYSDSSVDLLYTIKGRNSVVSQRYMGYLQNSYNYNLNRGEMNFTVGLRSSYWTFNNEFVVSPRASVSYIPAWEKDFLFRFSTGYYYQPAFYKEMRMQSEADENGNIQVELNSNIKAQKSIHFVLGSDYNFTAWNRPFKFVTEAYYKVLKDLVPYSIDNVRIIYQGYNNSDGYAMGLDMKVNGEFVRGVDSWLSVSLMRTEENIRDDGEFRVDTSGNSYWYEPGMQPRPSDQRLNIGMFFQDYFPGNPDYKMHLQINFGTGLPFGLPLEPVYNDSVRMNSYSRVDLGFSKVLKRADKNYPEGHWLHYIDESWISAEVFNLFDKTNTMSYEWVNDYQGNSYAVENSLTGRRLNVKLTVRF